MLSLFDATAFGPRPVTLSLELRSDENAKTTVNLQIQGVGRESGDGESWLIHGYGFEGYYSTKRRTG